MEKTVGVKPINIRLELAGDLLKKFEKIKQDMGLENSSDVVRFLISQEFKKRYKEE